MLVPHKDYQITNPVTRALAIGWQMEVQPAAVRYHKSCFTYLIRLCKEIWIEKEYRFITITNFMLVDIGGY